MKISFHRLSEKLNNHNFSINKLYYVGDSCKFLELNSLTNKRIYLDMKKYKLQIPPEYNSGIYYLELKDIDEKHKKYIELMNLEKCLVITNNKNFFYLDKNIDDIFFYKFVDKNIVQPKKEDNEINLIENEFNKIKESVLIDTSETFVEIKGNNKVIFDDDEIKEGSEFEKLIEDSADDLKININDEKIAIFSSSKKNENVVQQPIKPKNNNLNLSNYNIGDFYISIYIDEFYENMEQIDYIIEEYEEYLDIKEKDFLNTLFEKFDYSINEYNTNILYKFKDIEEDIKKLRTNKNKLYNMLNSCNNFPKSSERKDIEEMNVKIKKNIFEIDLNLLKHRDNCYDLLNKYSKFEKYLKELNL